MMTTLTVPLPVVVEKSIQYLIKSGYAANKAEVARKAILKAEEDEAVLAVLQSKQEIKEGKILDGNLRELVQQT